MVPVLADQVTAELDALLTVAVNWTVPADAMVLVGGVSVTTVAPESETVS
jgi:hypothetical protein